MKYLIVLFCVFLPLTSKANITQIPERDAQKIKSLFEFLICEHDFAYTIFGSKPMSLADVPLRMPDLPIYKQLHSQYLLLKIRDNLNAWYRYRHTFQFNDFIFLDKEEDLFECLVIVLIHKARLLAVLEENKNIFRKELGESFAPRSFIEKLENRKISLGEAIHHNYGLLGILLGFGIRNSLLFMEKYNLITQIDDRSGILLQENGLVKKLQHIESQTKNFNEFEALSQIMPLHFVADVNHPETVELRKRYKNDQQKITELMRNPNFMDMVMEQLMK